LDVLVNNAGIGVFGVAEELRFEEIQRVMETNFFGAVRLTQAFLPHLRASGGGAIAFMSSWMGRVPLAGMLTYACSKAALETFAETLAQEVLRFGVRVYILEPGYARTPMHGKAPRYELPEDTPYADLYRNWKAHWRVGYRNPTLPDAVSEALFRAIEEADPALRIVVGDDARQWIDARERASDELWREAGQPRELADFLAWAERVYGPGLFRG
ncbi:MAG: SDR family NAD(P)-dependent oxidoreductase, partial [Myxococcales bacterium]|nr:SDR family NAD(P)-dependent oxidoreductase [Myxococcales bacterium]